MNRTRSLTPGNRVVRDWLAPAAWLLAASGLLGCQGGAGRFPNQPLLGRFDPPAAGPAFTQPAAGQPPELAGILPEGLVIETPDSGPAMAAGPAASPPAAPIQAFAQRLLGRDLYGGSPGASAASTASPPPRGLLQREPAPGSDPLSAARDNARAVRNAIFRQPSNDRDWIPEHQLLASAEFEPDGRVTVHNIRNAEFFTYRDCVVDYYDKTFRLSDVQSVDFIVIPFADNRAIAHTLVSFGLADGDRIGVSVEVRLEKGENYDAAVGLLGQFELIYVVASEQDLIRVRTEHRGVDVYLYRGAAQPEQAQRLLADMLRRANKLRQEPEFYHTLSNNCTTNLVQHINALAPGKVPYDYRVLLPGYSDQLAYELGLIDNRLPFDELKRRSRINDLAVRYRDDPQFSAKIRGEKLR